MKFNIRDSKNREGPGDNIFSKDNVDIDGQIKLKINDKCAEIFTDELGYGTYEIEAILPIIMNKNIVFSPFLYEDDTHELDIEFSRWGSIFTPNCQFVIQPNNVRRFFSFKRNVKCKIDWQKDYVQFEVNGTKWLHKGQMPTKARFHINLWKLKDTKVPETEIIIKSFKFTK